ncbi:MAG: TraM recognition domain-containing protein [Gammaproteobacteria bacterium]|nr:TraM recognition domain-containing protein [Gammaproteobacteria bacterium]
MQRGLDADQEQNYRQLIRDTRTLGQRFYDFLCNSEAVAITLVVFAVASFIVPASSDYLFVAGFIAFIIAKGHKNMLPFRLPMRSHKKDYNSPKPGTNKPSMAAGIYLFGNEKKDNAELWFTNEDMRTHVLMFGSTGSGKTESLVSIAYNALLQSSGFIYVDGKGDNSLYSKVFSMVRYMGREDDLLLINFMTGARDIVGPQKTRLSNTLNPFAAGSSSMLSQLVISLMESKSDSSSGDMWKGRAMVFVEALMRVLVAMRDAEFILLDANVIRNYFTLDRLERIVLDRVFVRDDDDPISIKDFPKLVTEGIDNYLYNLPGYNKAKKGKQVSQVLEQHGFITMQLTRVFGSLADTYGHILRTRLAEVDMRDVVLNRRILTVLLPALEKSTDELANLGKVIIANLKAMMAAGLGEEVEGKYKEVVGRKPTNSRTPFLCILDEYGYYAVPGFAIVPAQARALGFSVIFAGQDLPALQKASKEEAATIGANTNIKICMKLEDPLETWDFFMKTGGESYVSQVESFQTDSRSMTSQYMDTKSARMEKRSRVDLLDLKEQREGEAHIFFKARIVRAKMFYANPRPVKEMRVNQLVKVGAPSDEKKRKLNNGFYYFNQLVKKKDFFKDVELSDKKEIDYLLDMMRKDTTQPLIERGVQTLLAYHDRDVPESISDVEDIFDQHNEGEIDIFSSLKLSDEMEKELHIDNIDLFSRAILDKTVFLKSLDKIGLAAGLREAKARTVATEIVNDFEVATYYPPTITDKLSVTDLTQAVDRVLNKAAASKKK